MAGGRNSPPSGISYSTVARFEKYKADWPQRAWSLTMDFSAAPETRNMAVVSFLVGKRAPQELLKPGSRFDLFEGEKLVASGEIID